MSLPFKIGVLQLSMEPLNETVPVAPAKLAMSLLALFQTTSLTPLNQLALFVSQVPFPPEPVPLASSRTRPLGPNSARAAWSCATSVNH